MGEWLSKLTTWLVDLVRAIFSSLGDAINDAGVKIAELVLSAISTGVAALPVPEFLGSGLGLGNLVGDLPPLAAYMANQMQIPAALGIIGAGVSFRLLRKLFTLGQW